jgi:serine/threonine protein kinase
MDGYELSSTPFFTNRNTSVRLFHGVSLLRNSLPVVIKRHDLFLVDKRQFLEDFNQVMNAGMAQARAEHSHSCKILELRLDFETSENRFSLYHILEALDRDLQKEIETRRQANAPLAETDLRTFLAQTSSALANAHKKVTPTQRIAHRDIKPQNIFLDSQGSYKIGDFGSYFEQKTTLHVSSVAGTLAYMSPQQRQIIAGQVVKYNPFQSDVFALGMTALSLATLRVLEQPWPLEGLEEIVRSIVCALGYSRTIQDLLLAMLSVDEDSRPSSQVIHDQLAPSVISNSTEEKKRPTEDLSGLASVWENRIKIIDFSRMRWVSSPLSSPIDIGEQSRYVWVDTGLFCSGGTQSLGQQSERSKQDAYLLKPGREWAVTRLADMITSRHSHGLWWYQAQRKVMVFGGTF